MFNAKSKKLKEIERQMGEVDTYEQWVTAAKHHDAVTGADEWRRDEKDDHFDHIQIRRRLDALRKQRQKENPRGLLFALNEGIHGNMGGMGNPELYKQAKFGTKLLVEQYVDEIVDSLEFLAGLDDKDISREERLDFFERASHCYGRSALMLSGGGALGTFHIGVLKALAGEKLLPNVISGASAGAIITGVAGVNTDEQLLEMSHQDALITEKTEEGKMLKKLLIGGRENINEDNLEILVKRLVPDLTFQEALELTGRHISISIAAADTHQSSRLLNAITSPNVYIRKAIMASCAVPGVFPSVELEAKNENGERQVYLPGLRWIDGSISDDLPAKRLARLYGVNHYIASLINPVVLYTRGGEGEHTKVPHFIRELIHHGAVGFAKASRVMTQSYTKDWKRFNLTLDVVNSIFSQEYTADINIYPDFHNFDLRYILTHLNEKELMSLERQGEVATWPQIERIRVSGKISRTLDKILERYDDEQLRHAAKKKKKTKAVSK